MHYTTSCKEIAWSTFSERCKTNMFEHALTKPSSCSQQGRGTKSLLVPMSFPFFKKIGIKRISI